MKRLISRNLPLSVFWSVVLFITYRFLDADFGTFLALTSVLFYLKGEQDKQISSQDARMDRVELLLVNREEYYQIIEQIIRLKAGQDILKLKLQQDENTNINQESD